MFYFILLFGFSLYALGLLFYMMPSTSAQDNMQISDLSCIATDSASFKKCLDDVQKDIYPLIRIVRTTNCNNRQDCEFIIKDVKKTISISGIANPEKSTIKRVGDYSFSVLSIINSANIKINDLSIDEGDGSKCQNGDCKPTIDINNSQKIQLKKIQVSGAKEAGIKITDSGQIGIINSNFSNSFKNALQANSAKQFSGILLEKNTFENNGSNAIVFKVKSSLDIPSIIRKNTFKGNNAQGSYASSCTYPCPAAQLLVDEGSENLLIEGNYIFAGSSPQLNSVGLYSSGLQLSAKDTSNITISCNSISGNLGSGIVETGTGTPKSLLVKNNRLFNNGLNLNIQKASIENNCFTENCQTSCLK